MIKPRMCFTLLYAEGTFHLSRNFSLQKVGDFEWLIENYEFESISRSVDELFILNVSRSNCDWFDFLANVKKVVKQCFMPVAVGGGLRTMSQARSLFDNGADKIVMGHAFFEDQKLVTELVEKYGSQSIVASIDFKRCEDGELVVFTDCGSKPTSLSIADAISQAELLGAGEIYLTSIERDGTGMGFDLDALEVAYNSCDLPIIAAGGADTSDQLGEGIRSNFVSAVSSAHLFNFMCDGLRDARLELISSGIPLSKWNFEEFDSC